MSVSVEPKSREKTMYFAKLAEQAGRYDEMAQHMRDVAKMSEELSEEERNMLALAYKNLMGSRRKSRQLAMSVEENERKRGKSEQAKWAAEYRCQIETELDTICERVLGLLDRVLVPKAVKASSTDDAVFYMRMRADYLRYAVEFAQAKDKKQKTEEACKGYDDAQKQASTLLGSDPGRMGLALNYAVFQHEVLGERAKATSSLQRAFENAVQDYKKAPDKTKVEVDMVMKLMQDNLAMWRGDPGASPADGGYPKDRGSKLSEPGLSADSKSKSRSPSPRPGGSKHK